MSDHRAGVLKSGPCLQAVVGLAILVGSPVVGILSARGQWAQAQTRAFSNPAFEVASVKPNTSGNRRVMLGLQPGGRFTATNVPLRLLILNAHAIQTFQLIGAPDWIESERFDIVAKAEGNLTPTPPGGPPGVLQLMLQSLLADRFRLAIHHETRELPIYALVLARADCKLGSQLRATAIDCEALMAAARARGGPLPAFPPPGERPTCGMRMLPGQMAGGSVQLSGFSMALSQFVQRTVIDRTGLTGAFDLDLNWTPDQLPQGPPPPGAPPLPPIDPNGPSIFTALEEQLGLKLEPQKGPVDVLVIDRVERPTPD